MVLKTTKCSAIHVPNVIVEHMEETGSEDGNDDNVSDKESDSDDDEVVTGDDCDGFDSDPERDPFDSALINV